MLFWDLRLRRHNSAAVANRNYGIAFDREEAAQTESVTSFASAAHVSVHTEQKASTAQFLSTHERCTTNVSRMQHSPGQKLVALLKSHHPTAQSSAPCRARAAPETRVRQNSAPYAQPWYEWPGSADLAVSAWPHRACQTTRSGEGIACSVPALTLVSLPDKNTTSTASKLSTRKESDRRRTMGDRPETASQLIPRQTRILRKRYRAAAGSHVPSATLGCDPLECAGRPIAL